MLRVLVVLACAACGVGAREAAAPSGDDALAARFPLARLGERALCDALLARSAEDYRITIDREPRSRRKVIVSDLHLGPGTTDPRFTGIEDFYSDADWTAFLAQQGAAGPTDLVIDGDFIEFWQIAAALGVLPRRDARVQPPAGTMLAEDQQFGTTAVALVIAAHPTVFRDLGRLLDSGDHRVIILAGNHDADLLWPKVQLAIARAIAPRDPSRLIFVEGAAYEHAGVHVEHGHAYDAANHFATGYAPFGRDRDGRCRLQASWGEVFVDQFYTDTERQIPFIDNLYPESAAVLWALHDDPQHGERGLAAAIRFLELLRSAETGKLNKDAAEAVLQSVFGTPGEGDDGPSSVHEVIDHLTEQVAGGDTSAASIVAALWRLRTDPDLAGLWDGIVRAAGALPDVGAALDELRAIDPSALGRLRDRAFGDVQETAAARLLAANPALHVIVFGHTHDVGGRAVAVRGGYFANSGSWISVASVAELKARGVTWDKLSLADRTMFPSKDTAVIIEYGPDGQPEPPVVHNR
ncbi:MAG TPA: hypothetical protein VLX92_22340 [Kofleriaceae bacterium]|nr:hypothetical protein [Kofleriaceae bacterium]